MLFSSSLFLHESTHPLTHPPTQIADELDFVPMDQFQKDQFTFRQDEWEDYVSTYPPLSVRQGKKKEAS